MAAEITASVCLTWHPVGEDGSQVREGLLSEGRLGF